MVYYTVYFLTKAVSFFLFPRRAYGLEHIPAQGGFIIACNHVSNLDPVVMGISSKRRINFMAKDSLFKGALAWLLPKLGAFPIKRGEADLGALKEGLKRLKKGNPVLVFVEGTRRIGDAPSKAQPGVGFLAVKSAVPVIPVYVEGTEKAMPPGSKSIKRHAVSVRFGPAVSFDPKSSYEEIADTILASVYSLKNSRKAVSSNP